MLTQKETVHHLLARVEANEAESCGIKLVMLQDVKKCHTGGKLCSCKYKMY